VWLRAAPKVRVTDDQADSSDGTDLEETSEPDRSGVS
jgi:hypothetical protein